MEQCWNGSYNSAAALHKEAAELVYAYRVRDSQYLIASG